MAAFEIGCLSGLCQNYVNIAILTISIGTKNFFIFVMDFLSTFAAGPHVVPELFLFHGCGCPNERFPGPLDCSKALWAILSPVNEP
jgi:hypothetical protein